MKNQRVARATIALAVLAVSACAPNFQVKDLAPAEQAAVKQMPIYNTAQLTNRNFKVLDVVEGVSCKRGTLEASASRSAAVDHAKYLALKLNADGITNLQFSDKEGTSYTANCWNMIRVSAEAIKFAPDSSKKP